MKPISPNGLPIMLDIPRILIGSGSRALVQANMVVIGKNFDVQDAMRICYKQAKTFTDVLVKAIDQHAV